MVEFLILGVLGGSLGTLAYLKTKQEETDNFDNRMELILKHPKEHEAYLRMKEHASELLKAFMSKLSTTDMILIIHPDQCKELREVVITLYSSQVNPMIKTHRAERVAALSTRDLKAYLRIYLE